MSDKSDRAPQPASVCLLWTRGSERDGGPEHAIRLLPPLLETLPDARLIIRGDGRDLAVARTLTADLRLNDRVTFRDTGADLDALLPSVTLLLVTDDPHHSRATVDAATRHGVPTFTCGFDPEEALRARRGGVGPYIKLARSIASALRHERVVADTLAGEALPLARFAPHADTCATAEPTRPGQDGSAIPGGARRRTSRFAGLARRIPTDIKLRRVEDRLVRFAAARFDRESGKAFVPLRTLDFSSLGLGDTLMAWVGVHALLHERYRLLAPGCTMYVQGPLVRAGSALFSRHGLSVRAADEDGAPMLVKPVLSPRSPRTLRELIDGTLDTDWCLNNFNAVEAQKPALRADARYDPWERFCLGITERIVHRRRGWQAAQAEYIGLRIWTPVARSLGLYPVPFLALCKRSLADLRAHMRAFVGSLGPAPAPDADVVVFPAGRSYQAFPVDFCTRIRDRLRPRSVVFYLSADDPWIDTFRASDLDVRCLATIEDVLRVLLASPKLITTDSFTSHAAQMLRDDFLLVLTRDVHENVLHPGAYPKVIVHHPRCAPCHYVPRVDQTSCPARYDRCVAFESEHLEERIAEAI